MKFFKNNFIAIAVTIIFTCLVLYKIDLSMMIKTFKAFDIKFLYLLLPVFLVIMTMRALRWGVILPKTDCKFYSLYEIYMTSNLLNIFLPARAGDIFRGCYFGQKYGISKLKAIGTVAAERILDGMTVVGILLLAIMFHNSSVFVIKLTTAAFVLFFTSFFTVLWIYKKNKIDVVCNLVKKIFKSEKTANLIDKINPHLHSFLNGFETFSDSKTMLKLIYYSILSWAGDCLFVYLLVIAFGIQADFTISMFIVSFIALSTIIPSSSIYVGLYQYAFILALGLFNIDKSQSLTIALSQQGVMLIAYFIVAAIFVLQNHIKISDFKKKEVDNNGKNP